MPRGPARSVLEFLGILFTATLVAFVMQAYLIKPFQIPTPSMVPTIDPGDRILVNRLAYHFGDIRRGDIIVFRAPPDPSVDYVKRVIALPGDTIEIVRGQVILNGVPQTEDYAPGMDLSIFPSQTVPADSLFVMGDNRGDSEDSRYWKSPWLPVDNVIGKAVFVYWPLDRIGTF